MNFAYDAGGSVKNFHQLRAFTQWAGALGIVQALVWMGLTIVAILSYNCLIAQPEIMTFGSLLGTVLMDTYFRGNCLPENYVQYANTILTEVPTLFTTQGTLIWMCVYLGVAVCWLIASIVLFTHVRQNSAKFTLIALYVWIVFTGCICVLDLALGIIFAIDYNSFFTTSFDHIFDTSQGGSNEAAPALLTAASTASATMMVIAFKGFLLWLINCGLMVYLLVQAIAIVNDKDGNDTLFMPRKDSDDILATTRPPINAYDEIQNSNAYTNEVFVSEEPMASTLELNQASLARAARMSTDASLQDHRFRNLDAYQQYPPPRSATQQAQSPQSPPAQMGLNNNGQLEGFKMDPSTPPVTSNYPVPDYSPPMVRSSAQGGGILRNQRYQ